MSKQKPVVIAIIGSTGLLGKALTKEANARGFIVKGVARKHADYCIDATDSDLLRTTLDQINANIVINAAAQVNLISCEKDRGNAYLINAGLVAVLAHYCQLKEIKLCHISTDHYFTKDVNRLHNEKSKVILLNEYARTKYAGECFAMTNANSLVLRTNIVGYRNWPEQPTFIEWVIGELSAGKPITMFNDFYTSSIDVRSFSNALFDLLKIGTSGLINLASSEVSNKMDFILRLAKKMNFDILNCNIGSVEAISGPTRAESLGLDVTYAEALLGYKLPNLDAVIDSLVQDYKDIYNAI